jgi:hypothetical protein
VPNFFDGERRGAPPIGCIDGWKNNSRLDDEQGHAVESNPKACLDYIRRNCCVAHRQAVVSGCIR